MKNRDLITLFLAGTEEGKGSNLEIQGRHLVNYDTVIASWNGRIDIENIGLLDHMELEINCRKYSKTTSKIQHELARQVNKLKKANEKYFFLVLHGHTKEVEELEKIIFDGIR